MARRLVYGIANSSPDTNVRPSRAFMGDRGSGARYHAGTDYLAEAGQQIRAPLTGKMSTIGWRTKDGVGPIKALMFRGQDLDGRETTVLLAPVNFVLESAVDVEAGAAVGHQLGSYAGAGGEQDHVHTQVYTRELRSTPPTRDTSWPKSDAMPEGLLDPQAVTWMIDPADLSTKAQRQAALLLLGFAPDPVGYPWGEASTTALRAAQEKLGIEADGVWGSQTRGAVAAALEELGPRPETTPLPAPTSGNDDVASVLEDVLDDAAFHLERIDLRPLEPWLAWLLIREAIRRDQFLDLHTLGETFA